MRSRLELCHIELRLYFGGVALKELPSLVALSNTEHADSCRLRQATQSSAYRSFTLDGQYHGPYLRRETALRSLDDFQAESVMLRDRFSVNSTPSSSPPPQNRNYSPAPRTSSRLAVPPQRPGISRQSSILSLASGSTSSLPSTARVPNGSPLKKSTEPPPNVPDPLKVLKSILGLPESSEDDEAVNDGEIENDVLDLSSDIDFGELSLQEFVDLHDEQKNYSQEDSSEIPETQLCKA